MNVTYLKEFVVLAGYTKLTSAAKAMYISPSTLSQHITALEKEIGCELFTRTPDGFLLTREGEAALAHAQNIIFEYGALLRDCTNEEGATMRLSVPNYNFGLNPILSARRAFFETHPNTKAIITSNELQGRDPFEIIDTGLSDTSAVFLVRGGGRHIEDMVDEETCWIRLGTYRPIFLSDAPHPEIKDFTLTTYELDKSTITLRLAPVCTILVEGVSNVLATYKVSPKIVFTPLTRNQDVFNGKLDDNTFMMWFEPAENSYTMEIPDIPIYRFEHELLADAYLLYKPTKLDPLQLDYVDTLREVLEDQAKPETE